MLKTTITILMLFFHAIAFADCGLVTSGATMTIVIGKKAGKCSEEFATAFKEAVADALDEDDARSVAQKRPFDDRNTRGQKLWSIAERQYQAAPGGRYFGQKR